MSIVAADSITSFFDEVLEDALKAKRVEPSQGAARYLVGVLTDYAHPDQGLTLGKPLALALQEALVTSEPAERFNRLRQLGDAILYASGFFAEHFSSRGIETRYVASIGVRAYGSAGAMLSTGTTKSTLFDELASRFDEFSMVFCEVAERTLGHQTSRDLVKLYERWLKTGSDTVAGALVEQGIFPTRATKGVQ